MYIKIYNYIRTKNENALQTGGRTMLGVFKKHNNKTNVSILELSKNQQITFNVPTNSELKIQMDMLHISKEDLQIVKVLQPFIYEEIDWITEKFYSNITKQPNLIMIIERYSSIPKLKQTLKTHIKELFSGDMHEDFIEQRVRIAKKDMYKLGYIENGILPLIKNYSALS